MWIPVILLPVYLLWRVAWYVWRYHIRPYILPAPGGIPWVHHMPDDPTARDVSQLLFQYCNDFRRAHGLPALTWNPRLELSSYNQSYRMKCTGEFAHTLSDGLTLSQRMERVGYLFASCRENIAYHTPMHMTPQQLAHMIHTGWVDSPGHRENLLARECTEMGVAVVGLGRGGVYYTQNFGLPRFGSVRHVAPPRSVPFAPGNTNAKVPRRNDFRTSRRGFR